VDRFAPALQLIQFIDTDTTAVVNVVVAGAAAAAGGAAVVVVVVVVCLVFGVAARRCLQAWKRGFFLLSKQTPCTNSVTQTHPFSGTVDILSWCARGRTGCVTGDCPSRLLTTCVDLPPPPNYCPQKNPLALPKVLMAVRWNNSVEVAEMHKLLERWSPMQPLDAMELLSPRFPDGLVCWSGAEGRQGRCLTSSVVPT